MKVSTLECKQAQREEKQQIKEKDTKPEHSYFSPYSDHVSKEYIFKGSHWREQRPSLSSTRFMLYQHYEDTCKTPGCGEKNDFGLLRTRKKPDQFSVVMAFY